MQKIIIGLLLVLISVIIYKYCLKQTIGTRLGTRFFLDSSTETDANKKLLCTALANKYGTVKNIRWWDSETPVPNNQQENYKNLWISMNCNDNSRSNILLEQACKTSTDSKYKEALGCPVEGYTWSQKVCTAMLNKYGGKPGERWWTTQPVNDGAYIDLWNYHKCNDNYKADLNIAVSEICNSTYEGNIRNVLECNKR